MKDSNLSSQALHNEGSGQRRNTARSAQSASYSGSCSPSTPKPCSNVLRFTVIKEDAETGEALSGAVYALYQTNELISRAVSDENGRLRFTDIFPGIYELRELTPPPGYEQDTTAHLVRIERSGSITIDGTPLASFQLTNTPIPVVMYPFSFIKLDATTEAPLPGVTFRLSTGAVATSNQAGLVDFGTLAAGTYTLVETAVPPRYRLSTAVHTIVISEGGMITVDGSPLSAFLPTNDRLISASPSVAIVTADDLTITGTGIPGALITIIFPDFSIAQGVVNPNGTWSIPSLITLTAGQTLRVNQTQEGYFASPVVPTVVQAADTE